MSITRNISLNVLADMEAFRKNMATMPGTTEKQAAAAARKMQNTFTKAHVAAAKQAKASAKEGMSAWGKMGKISLALGSVVAIGKGFFELQKKLADTVNQFNDMSKQTDIAAGTLQAIDLAAQRSGSSLDELKSGIIGLPKRISDAANGMGEAKIAFEGLGIAVTNSDGSLRSSNDVILEATSKLGQMSDRTLAAAYATNIFGESGVKLAQVTQGMNLEGSIALIDKWGISAKESKDSASNWQEDMANLTMVIGGMTSKVMAATGAGDLLKNTTLFLIHEFGVLEAAANVLKTTVEGDIAVFNKLINLDFSGALDAAVQATKNNIQATKDLASSTTVAGSAAMEYQQDLANATVSTKDATEAEKEHSAAILEQIRINKEAKEKALKDAKEREAQAKKDASAAEARRKKALADKKRADAAEAKSEQDKRDKVADIVAGIEADNRSADEAIEFRRKQRLDAVEAADISAGERERARALINDQADAELAEVEKARLEENTKVAEAESEKRMAQQEKENAKKKAISDATAARDVMLRDATLRNIALVADAFAEASKKRLAALKKQRKTLRDNIKDEREREGGARDWVIKMNQDKLSAIKTKARNEQILRQAAGVVSVLSNAAIAYMGIVANPAVIAASGGFGAPATAAAIIGPPTAIQLAAVKSQNTTFHTGTDEVQATLLAGEAVLNRTAADAIGRDNIAAANRGDSMGGGQMQIDVVFRDQVIDTMVSAVAKADGALSRMLPAPRMQLDPYGAR